MIRFINLTGQILMGNDPYFAWFDTITGTFMTFSGFQAWDCWGDFVKDYDGDNLERFRSLMPRWGV